MYLADGSVWLLEKVRHIPNLRRNLISVGKLDDEGHAILFVCGTWKVTQGARVLTRGKKTGTLYMTSSPKDTITVRAVHGSGRSIFDPTRTRPVGVGWRGRVTRNRPPEKSIGSVFCDG